MSLANISQEQVNTIDPNEKQQIASNPAQSVWVSASAGTGKTKILTDRVLRLLLSDEDRPASPPERIVCITFTKAAASEMANRITDILSNWSIWDDSKLLDQNQKGSLASVTGSMPTPTQIREARTLFARVIDVPGGLKIMTIHAFCTAILQKFPLEAGLSPNFTVLTDSETKDAINKSRMSVLAKAKQAPDSELGVAIRNLSVKAGESHLLKFLESGLKEKQQILSLFKKIGDIANLKPALFDYCELDKNTDIKQLNAEFIDNTPIDNIKLLRDAYTNFGTPKEQEKTQILNNFLEKRNDAINYSKAFFKKDGTPPAKLATKKVLESNAIIAEIIEDEITRYKKFEDKTFIIKMIEDTYDFLIVAHAILDAYMAEKQQRNALDFDDLINKTHELLVNSDSAAQWVLFKLDQGIDHLLVDEAQDTNPEQWSVIEALSEEFFHGVSARDDIERTLFVVGDEKQSIYSFQKADPKIFSDMQAMFKDKISRASKKWEDVPLNLSFRSTDAVLTLVDLVFAQFEMQSALTAQNLEVEHSAFRKGQAGHVELWPVIYGEEREELEPWPIPNEPTNQSSAANTMAKRIAGTIRHWIDDGRKLQSEDRPIHAGDILILLKKRSQFQKNLVRALKEQNIPVGGLDRMVLQDHIAVKDVLAMLEFGLLPQDNLTLATILKSPIIGWNEDQLMNFVLQNNKATSLWVALKEYAPDIYEYLLSVHDLTLKKRSFDVISFILNSQCPQEASGLKAFVKRLGEDAIDPLQELLNNALDTETEKGLSVQSFVHRLKQDTKEIKREMEDGANAVRIMTVHGSKGLQSPIVFLPDTMRDPSARDNSQNSDSKLLWPRRSGLDYPFWTSSSKENQPEIFRNAKENALISDDREYQRLLYVALTRASDELYISGYQNTKNRDPLPNSWYHMIKSGLDHAIESGVRAPCSINIQDDVITISNEQTVEAKDKSTGEMEQKPAPLPSWATNPPRKEPTPSRPIQPSRPSGEVSSLSPLARSTEHRYKRGNIIHTLLEFLPNLPTTEREEAAFSYIGQDGHDLNEKAQKDIVTEIIKILSDPVFAPVFGKGSRAEVPISGKLNDSTIINGQIDRLVITDTEIFIVDYKTNRPAAESVEDVPHQYIKQMQSYSQVLSIIYPNHNIKTAILWTNLPELMEI